MASKSPSQRGRANKRKGGRVERELVKILDGARIRGRVLSARKVPLSGAAKDSGFGGDVLVGQKCLAHFRRSRL